MQVNSVSLSANANNMAFKATPEEHVFANLKDKDLRKIAFAKASDDVNDRKHRAIDNTLFYSLPLAGGLSAAVRDFAPEAVAQIGKQNIRSLRLAKFGLVSASWAAGLAALSALWNTKDYLAQKIDIIKNNPVISSVATFAAGFGVLAAVDKYGFKGLMKVINSVDDKKVMPYIKKVRSALNNSKVLNKASEYISKFPSPIRDMAKGAAELAPLLIIGTQIAHMFGHQRVKTNVAARNYEDLKQAQQNVRENIADEKIDVSRKTIAELHDEYEQMLQTKPIIDKRTNEPVTFEQFVKLATTIVK